MDMQSLKKPMLASLLVAAFLVGCGKKGSDKNTSSATGWKINAKEGGFQYNTNFKEQVTGPGLVFVEGGTFTMGKVQDDVMHDWNNTPSQQHVQSFYMDETEVTNKMYMEYLDWLKQVFPPEDKDGHYKNIYLGALPDTLVWRSPLSANETMVSEYLRHPAYAEYPVVGVNWVQATQFSSWRTNRVNESILEKDGYIQQGSRYQVDAESTFSFGLYDMAGNVAEWVADVYRPRVDDELSDFNYYRGNVYTKNKIGEDGKLVVVDAQSITYDTLSNGRIIARNLPGQLAKVAVDDNETYLRYNFTTADNRNYRDGDRVSSKEYAKLTMDRHSENIDSLTASQRANVSRTMYNSPNQKILSDGQGGIIKVYDRSNDRTTLIDDEARVIKGGSWRDRAYWIDPAQRRYLPQYSATDYIGFRCAMSRVGSKAKKGKSSRG